MLDRRRRTLSLVLVVVVDQDALSYYGETLLCATLRWSRIRLEKARRDLQEADHFRQLQYHHKRHNIIHIKYIRNTASDSLTRLPQTLCNSVPLNTHYVWLFPIVTRHPTRWCSCSGRQLSRNNKQFNQQIHQPDAEQLGTTQ